MWECGIPLCKELAGIYETKLFDYDKLASILVSCHGTMYEILSLVSSMLSLIPRLSPHANGKLGGGLGTRLGGSDMGKWKYQHQNVLEFGD